MITGFGSHSYILGLDAMLEVLKKEDNGTLTCSCRHNNQAISEGSGGIDARPTCAHRGSLACRRGARAVRVQRKRLMKS
jgi:hypothetical protein